MNEAEKIRAIRELIEDRYNEIKSIKDEIELIIGNREDEYRKMFNAVIDICNVSRKQLLRGGRSDPIAYAKHTFCMIFIYQYGTKELIRFYGNIPGIKRCNLLSFWRREPWVYDSVFKVYLSDCMKYFDTDEIEFGWSKKTEQFKIKIDDL